MKLTIQDLISDQCKDLPTFLANPTHVAALKDIIANLQTPLANFEFWQIGPKDPFMDQAFQAKLSLKKQLFMTLWSSPIANLNDDQRTLIANMQFMVNNGHKLLTTTPFYVDQFHSEHKKLLDNLDLWLQKRDLNPERLQPFKIEINNLALRSNLKLNSPFSPVHFSYMVEVVRRVIKRAQWPDMVRLTLETMLNAYCLQHYPVQYDALVEPIVDGSVVPKKSQGYFWYSGDQILFNVMFYNGSHYSYNLKQLMDSRNEEFQAVPLTAEQFVNETLLQDALDRHNRYPTRVEKILAHTNFVRNLNLTKTDFNNRNLLDKLLDHPGLFTFDLIEHLTKNKTFSQALLVRNQAGKRPYQKLAHPSVDPEILRAFILTPDIILLDYLAISTAVQITQYAQEVLPLLAKAVDSNKGVNQSSLFEKCMISLCNGDFQLHDSISTAHLVGLFQAGMPLRTKTLPSNLTSKYIEALKRLPGELQSALIEESGNNLFKSTLLPQWYKKNRHLITSEQKRGLVRDLVIEGRYAQLANLLRAEDDLQLDLPALWNFILEESKNRKLPIDAATVAVLSSHPNYESPGSSVMFALSKQPHNQVLVEALKLHIVVKPASASACSSTSQNVEPYVEKTAEQLFNPSEHKNMHKDLVLLFTLRENLSRCLLPIRSVKLTELQEVDHFGLTEEFFSAYQAISSMASYLNLDAVNKARNSSEKIALAASYKMVFMEALTGLQLAVNSFQSYLDPMLAQINGVLAIMQDDNQMKLTFFDCILAYHYHLNNNARCPMPKLPMLGDEKKVQQILEQCDQKLQVSKILKFYGAMTPEELTADHRIHFMEELQPFCQHFAEFHKAYSAIMPVAMEVQKQLLAACDLVKRIGAELEALPARQAIPQVNPVLLLAKSMRRNGVVGNAQPPQVVAPPPQVAAPLPPYAPNHDDDDNGVNLIH